MYCRYKTYKYVERAPTRTMYRSAPPKSYPEECNKAAYDAVHQWLARSLREWPNCPYGGTVELRLLLNSDDTSLAYLFCAQCSAKYIRGESLYP